MFGVTNIEQFAQFWGNPLLENLTFHSPCTPAQTSTAPWCSPRRSLSLLFALSAPGKKCPLQIWAWWTPGEGIWKQTILTDRQHGEDTWLVLHDPHYLQVKLEYVVVECKLTNLFYLSFKMSMRLSLLLPLTFFFHWVSSVIRDLDAGLCPGECHAVPASGGCVLPPLSPAVFQPVTV